MYKFINCEINHVYETSNSLYKIKRKKSHSILFNILQFSVVPKYLEINIKNSTKYKPSQNFMQ